MILSLLLPGACRDFFGRDIPTEGWGRVTRFESSAVAGRSRGSRWFSFQAREDHDPQSVVFFPASVSTDVKYRDARGRLVNRGTCAGRAVLVTARRWNPARGDSRRDGNTISERWMTSGNRPERRVYQWQRPSSADGDAGSNPAAANVDWLFRVGRPPTESLGQVRRATGRR